MSYEEYINLLNDIKTFDTNLEKLEILKKTPVNPNIKELLIPKIIDLIKYKFQKTISKIKDHLDELFDDINYLDLALVNFKKETNYIIDLIDNPIINEKDQEELLKMVYNDTDKVYDILIKEADNIDRNGTISIVIKNNRIKWRQ